MVKTHFKRLSLIPPSRSTSTGFSLTRTFWEHLFRGEFISFLLCLHCTKLFLLRQGLMRHQLPCSRFSILRLRMGVPLKRRSLVCICVCGGDLTCSRTNVVDSPCINALKFSGLNIHWMYKAGFALCGLDIEMRPYCSTKARSHDATCCVRLSFLPYHGRTKRLLEPVFPFIAYRQNIKCYISTRITQLHTRKSESHRTCRTLYEAAGLKFD